MIKQGILPIACSAIALASAGAVRAQDAAENAVILSGAPAQQSSADTLSNAISGAMSRAGDAIREAQQGNGAPSGTPTRRRGGGGATSTYFPMPGIVAADALAHADVATYRLENGVRMRISGMFLPSDTTICEAFCPGS